MKNKLITTNINIYTQIILTFYVTHYPLHTDYFNKHIFNDFLLYCVLKTTIYIPDGA